MSEQTEMTIPDGSHAHAPEKSPKRKGKPSTDRAGRKGVWLAHAPVTVSEDLGLQWRVLSSEMAALRVAVEQGWRVTFLAFGQDPHDILR